MQRHGAVRHRILPLLREAGGVTPDNVKRISVLTGVPEADVWGAGRFYELLSHPDAERRVEALHVEAAVAPERVAQQLKLFFLW